MVEYRKARHEEREEYIRFANEVFFPGEDMDFEKILPKMYGKEINSAEHQFVAMDDEKGLRGLVAVMPNVLEAGGQELKIGYIGTVSVHAEARGEGHMKKLMHIAIEEMKKNGTDISYLNGQRQRYEYFGFYRAGAAIRYEITKANVIHALKDISIDGVDIRLMLPGSEEEHQAKCLHKKQRVRYLREEVPFSVYCTSYLNHALAVYRSGKFIGYFVSDGQMNRMSEIDAVTPDDLDCIIKAMILGKNLDRLSFSMPEWYTEMNRHLQGYAESICISSNVQAKIFRFAKVIGVMLTAKSEYQKLQDGRMDFDVEGERFGIEVKDGNVLVCECGEHPLKLTSDEANQLFLSPRVCGEMPGVPQGWFPLPLYVTAPDKF